jgi:hypothetical protein
MRTSTISCLATRSWTPRSAEPVAMTPRSLVPLTLHAGVGMLVPALPAAFSWGRRRCGRATPPGKVRGDGGSCVAVARRCTPARRRDRHQGPNVVLSPRSASMSTTDLPSAMASTLAPCSAPSTWSPTSANGRSSSSAPVVLTGTDHGPTPIEFVLLGLAAQPPRRRGRRPASTSRPGRWTTADVAATGARTPPRPRH